MRYRLFAQRFLGTRSCQLWANRYPSSGWTQNKSIWWLGSFDMLESVAMHSIHSVMDKMLIIIWNYLFNRLSRDIVANK